MYNEKQASYFQWLERAKLPPSMNGFLQDICILMYQVKHKLCTSNICNSFKVDGTSFSDAGSLVTTVHLTREICPQDVKYRKSKTNIGAQKLLLTRCFFPVCPRLDQNKSCPLGVSCFHQCGDQSCRRSRSVTIWKLQVFTIRTDRKPANNMFTFFLQ